MLNGGYILLDLTKYGDIADADNKQITLTNDEVNKFILAFSGKPLYLKFKYATYEYAHFVNLRSDNLDGDIYFSILSYDQNTILGNMDLNVSNKTLTAYEFE